MTDSKIEVRERETNPHPEMDSKEALAAIRAAHEKYNAAVHPGEIRKPVCFTVYYKGEQSPRQRFVVVPTEDLAHLAIQGGGFGNFGRWLRLEFADKKEVPLTGWYACPEGDDDWIFLGETVEAVKSRFLTVAERVVQLRGEK